MKLLSRKFQSYFWIKKKYAAKQQKTFPTYQFIVNLKWNFTWSDVSADWEPAKAFNAQGDAIWG